MAELQKSKTCPSDLLNDMEELVKKVCDWVVVHQDTFKVECKRCGATELPPLTPISVTDFVKWGKMFTDKHQKCKEE